MTRLRSLLFARRWLALAVVLAALAVRIVVPAGLMPAFAGGATFTICTGHGAVPGDRPDPARPDMPCAFTGLLAAALDAPVVPDLPAMPLPVAAALVAGLVAITTRSGRLRPPLRAPPARIAA